MSCYCTGACRALGFCPNQQHGESYVRRPYTYTPFADDDTKERLKRLEEQVAALKKLVAPKKARK